MSRIDEPTLDQLFREARTHFAWQAREVPDTLLQELFDLVRMGPTSANCSPLRIEFIKSDAAKNRLKPCLMDGNVEKTMSAPVTAILAFDTLFYEHMDQLYPPAPEEVKGWWRGEENSGNETAFRNSTLQAGYLIMAARALGLDCGPMSGFDKAAVDREFFPEGRFRSNFLCNLGYGIAEKLHPRLPRFEFKQVCRIL
ncbi:MAG: malonic semialdehyde reductase [Gammaproteobacteria bacterium]|nr:MAG: malonic semialdehyde reductase [Gammaproteobacteria bacterium]